MSVPSQLFWSGNMSWIDKEHGKNGSMYLNIKYDPISALINHQRQGFLTIFIVILTMALIALIMVGAMKTWLAMHRGDHSNDMEMENLNEDKVAHDVTTNATFTAVEIYDY